MNSQNELILKDLKKGARITPLDALGKYGCFRLGGRVYDLKNGVLDGIHWNIITNIIEVKGKRVAQYYLGKPRRI
jgi:hypothetical protein